MRDIMICAFVYKRPTLSIPDQARGCQVAIWGSLKRRIMSLSGTVLCKELQQCHT